MFFTSRLAKDKPTRHNEGVSRDYGQYCALARALELIGGRWALLIVRDLLTGPKRFTDLAEGLPGIPTNVLSARLRELEEAGIIQRRLKPRPATGVAYELTEWGRELEDPLTRLGFWAARTLGEPEPGEHFNISALAVALRGAFDAERAKAMARTFELRIDGKSIAMRVEHGSLDCAPTVTKDATVIEGTAPAIAELMTGRATFDDAVKAGRVRVQGSRTDARRFFDVFRIPRAGVQDRSLRSSL